LIGFFTNGFFSLCILSSFFVVILDLFLKPLGRAGRGLS
jgi:hypothetical protein